MGRLLTGVLAIGVAVVVVVLTFGLVFIVGMRTKAPFVIDAVRRFNRSVTNPRLQRSAGAAGASASLVRHIGRMSGRSYATPVDAIPTSEGFVIALPYGTRADWLRNVLASGGATIEHDGASHRVDQPTLVATADVAEHLGAGERRMLRLFNVTRCLRVRHARETQQPPATKQATT